MKHIYYSFFLILLLGCASDPLYKKPDYKILKIDSSKFGAVKAWPTLKPGVNQLEAGVYSGPISFSGTGQYEIVGAGTGRTLLKMKDSEWPPNIKINAAHVVFKNMTIENANFGLSRKGRGDFVRVDFAEFLKFSTVPHRSADKFQVRMVNVTIPGKNAIKFRGTKQPYHSVLSVNGIWFALSRQAPNMAPTQNLGYYIAEGVPWFRQKKVESFDNPEAQKLMAETYGQFKKRKKNLARAAGNKFQDDLFAWANKARLEGQSEATSTNKSMVAKLLKETDRHHRKKNYLLEFYALYKADVANGHRIDQDIKRRQDKNMKKLSELYGCQTTYTRAKGGTIFLRNSWGVYDVSTAYEMFLGTANKVIPFVASLGSSDSKCFLELLVVKDYFKGEDSEKKVVAESANWVESQASKERRRKLQQAAADARWRASQNQFSSSLDRLNSTAKQLHENRNRLEERSDGLYLVSPNKRIKGASITDIQKQNRLDEEARKTARVASSSGAQYVQKGKIQTLNYFKTWTNEVQFNLRLTKDKKQLNYEFPLKKSNRNKSCKDTKNTSSRFNTGLDDSCRNVYYHEDRGLRKFYIEKFVELPVQDFLATEVLPSMLREMQKKAKSSDKESQLDALLLANLIADKEDPALDKKAMEVLGEPIDYNDYKQTFMNYR